MSAASESGFSTRALAARKILSLWEFFKSPPHIRAPSNPCNPWPEVGCRLLLHNLLNRFNMLVAALRGFFLENLRRLIQYLIDDPLGQIWRLHPGRLLRRLPCRRKRGDAQRGHPQFAEVQAVV